MEISEPVSEPPRLSLSRRVPVVLTVRQRSWKHLHLVASNSRQGVEGVHVG